MKNLLSVYLKIMLVLTLFYTGTTLGSEVSAETVFPKTISVEAGQFQSVPDAQAGFSYEQGVSTQNTVLLAQQPSRPNVVGEAIRSQTPILPSQEWAVAEASPPVTTITAQTSSSDPFIYSELERLTAAIEKLKEDTKKPDTKKAWSNPKLTGRLFLDSYTADEDANINRLKNTAGIREMQFAISGNGFDSFDYKFELSLSPGGTANTGRVNLVDNWIGVKNVPFLGYVRAGHFKPEIGLAFPTSALHTPLTEFITPSRTFGLGRRFGVSSEHLFAKDRIRLFYGVFQGGEINNSRSIQDDNPGTVFNARLTAAPIYENEGRQVFHIGGHWAYVQSQNDSASLSANPGGINWFTSLLGTGSFANNNHHRAGLELALQNGRLSASSEWYVVKYADHGTSPERTASGGYVELGYFLTNDYRSYQLKSGAFGSAKVKHNFHPFQSGDWNLIDGLGAWQLIFQWGYLDLQDWRNVSGNGGRQNDLTFGVNWFWTSNIRWIFEYVHSQQNTGSNYLSQSEDIFGTSLRLHF
ncbi:MAG: OprO/OprP family phosphate-selective porin [Planctomycetaceae bacterium]|jgi:phosphate-selective porin OprO/OprP|nr:OprO/OprP family phosphate-selective porin [Planctomycetaceae bacterium]